MDMAVRPVPPAWDASVDPDAVRLVSDPRALKEAVRDFRPLASGDALEVQAEHPRRAHPKLQQVGPRMAAAAFQSQSQVHFQTRHAAQEFPPQAAGPEFLPEPKPERQVAHSAPPDE
jgi:hypothetical protein